MTKTFTLKHDQKKNCSETRRIKKGWKKPFNSARRLKESPTISNNYYDDDNDSWFVPHWWSYPLYSYDSDSDSDSYVYIYKYCYQCCVCDVNEGHNARYNPDLYQQTFHQRKQARKSCDKWKRERYDYYYNESKDYCNNSSDEDNSDRDWDESSYDSNSSDDGDRDWDESSYDSDSNSSDEDDGDCDWDESDNPNSNSSNGDRDWYYILLVAVVVIAVTIAAVAVGEEIPGWKP